MLSLFGIERATPYETVERLYSDPLVIMILNDIFVSTLKKWDREMRCDRR